MKITRHARERGRGRLTLSPESFERLAAKALAEGVTHGETRGQLNRYLSKLFLEHGNANNSRIYAEQVFLFSGTTLVTVFPLPRNLKSTFAKIRDRKRQDAEEVRHAA